MKQKDIVKKIRNLGHHVTVINASFMNEGGIPDTIIGLDGVPAFCEIKIDNDKLSKLQENFRDKFYKNWFLLHYDSKKKLYDYDFDEGVDLLLLSLFGALLRKLNEGVKG
jgi:hypothetical protein